MGKKLTFKDARTLTELYCGKINNLRLVEEQLEVSIVTRDDWIEFKGSESNEDLGCQFFETLNAAREQGIQIRQNDFKNILSSIQSEDPEAIRAVFENPIVIPLKRKSIVPKTINQKQYLNAIQKHEIVFGVGPAGTGKTYLAMAVALSELLAGNVDKVIITRPAVEAGEALGFLPGDLEEKILPYLRPIYDAMDEMLGKEEALKIIERGNIEIAPLAYMRGRTLTRAFVVLDEAQNTTREQMMMFLTRLGDGSRMIITGDVTQTDLPKSKKSGLKEATKVLEKVEGIKLFYLDRSDVVRHPLVQKIIEAYEKHSSE